MKRYAADDALAWPVPDSRSHPTRPTRAKARSAATGVIAHRIERELFGSVPVCRSRHGSKIRAMVEQPVAGNDSVCGARSRTVMACVYRTGSIRSSGLGL